MKLVTNADHRQFFRKNHLIEFENLMSQSQLEELNQAIKLTLSERVGIRPERVLQEQSEKLFKSGYNLWRDNDHIKKLVLSSHLAEVASDLIEFRPLRLAYDQFYSTTTHQKHVFQQTEPNAYQDLLLQPRSLKEVSSVQGILCGLMICLAGEKEEQPKENTEEESGHKQQIFSSNPGNGVFFSPEALLDFHTLSQKHPHRYLLITYTHPTSIYFLQDTNPQTHQLKNLGYVFGDKLSDKLNPIVFR